MNKIIVLVVVVVVVLLLLQPAGAAGRDHDRRTLKVVSTGVGLGMTAGYFALNDWNWKWDSARHGITAVGAMALTTVGCMALSPIVATAVLDRPLTYREAHVMAGSCLIPIVGGWLVDQAYEHHLIWAPDEPQPEKVTLKTRHGHHHRR